jgi:hypothetical protein
MVCRRRLGVNLPIRINILRRDPGIFGYKYFENTALDGFPDASSWFGAYIATVSRRHVCAVRINAALSCVRPGRLTFIADQGLE